MNSTATNKINDEISVMLVDDHTLVRKGFCRLIEAENDLQVIGEADNGKSAIENYLELKPDVTVMDLSMPGIGGLDLIKKIREKDPAAKLIILTIHENEPFPSRALEEGAMGYITKHCDPVELLTAIRSVAHGKKYIDTETEKKISSNEHIEEKKLLSSLTSREFQIFTMLANGKSYIEIAEEIELSPKTVQVHRANLLKKLKITSTPDIIHMAIRHNISEAVNMLNH